MPSIKLQSGDTAHYSYDPQLDQLTVRLRDDPASVDESVHPVLRRAHVRRDAATGDIVGLRVSGVQELILEAVVRDLVAQIAPPESAVVAGASAVATEVDTAETPPAPVAGDSGSPDTDRPGDQPPPGERKKKKRKRKRKKKRPDDAAPQAEPDASAGVVPPAEPGAPSPMAEGRPSGSSVSPETDAPPDEVDAAPAVAEPSPEADMPSGRIDATPPEADVSSEADSALDAPAAPDETAAPAAPDSPAVPTVDSGSGAMAPDSFAFMNLHPSLSRAIADMGFAEPTPIQRRAVPEAMTGRDMVGLAQTGTGKTLSFLVPGLQRMLTTGDGKHRPRLLVVTPVRELAVQVAEQAEILARHTDLRVVTVYGGANMRAQSSALQRGVDVIVATPGRLLDHLRRRNADLSSVELLVLDEADRMLDMGFLPDVREILHNLPAERQTLLFGATMPPAIESLSLQFQRDPVLVEIARQLPPEGIEQLLYPVGKHLKVPLLVHLLSHDPDLQRVLVFTERRTEADLVSRRLRDAGLEVAAMHGDIKQRERERSLERLRDGKVQVLVATNVAARGLDVEGISHVVNYDIPQTVDDYIHRIGRTARADATGTAYTFIAPGDQWMVKRIESALERELPRVEAEGFDYDVPTPSWAQPSPDDVARSLEKPKSAADISRRMRPR